MRTQSAPRPARNIAGPPISLPPNEIARLARQLATQLGGGVPELAALPGDRAATEIAAAARLCLDWALRRIDGGALPERTDRLQTAAARWCRDGIPIEVVLHAVHEGFKTGLDMLFARADGADATALVAGATTALELLDLITATVSQAYVGEGKAAASDHHAAVHTLTAALLGGHATSKMARECGIAVAPEYFVLAVWLPPHPGETHPRLNPQVVARRKLRRVQAALAKLVGETPLAMLSVDGGTVLVPTTACAESELDTLVGSLSELAGVPITATVVTAESAGVPAAADHAHELLDTVRRMGAAPGVHRFSELALHYQLTRPGPGRDVLESRLAPLDDHPELLQTLRIFFRCDLNRQRTARQLCVHPNTVDYRLRRIGQLTGFDPTRTTGLWYLRSALIARAGLEATAPAPVPATRTA